MVVFVPLSGIIGAFSFMDVIHVQAITLLLVLSGVFLFGLTRIVCRAYERGGPNEKLSVAAHFFQVVQLVGGNLM